jgi:hypothetical protein
MGQTKGPPIKQLDRRVVDRYLRRGVLADKDFKQHIKELPDLDGQFETIVLPEDPSKKTPEEAQPS